MEADAAAVERLLLDRLAADLADARACSPPPLSCPDHSLLTSTWQKAVRRGATELAVAAGLALHRENPAYVWRRIRGIALEEVSVADPALAARVLAIAGKGALRSRLGDQAVLALLTAQLCMAPKSRLACDLLVWADSHPDVAAFRQAALNGPTEPLPRSLTWPDAARVQLIAGLSKYVRGRWQCLARADPRTRDRWLEQVHAPPLVRYIARRGSGTDGLNLMLVLVWHACAATAAVSDSIEPPTRAREWIGGVPAFGWCLYSAPGREALRLLAHTAHPLAVALRDAGARDPAGALGRLVFYAQGGFCRRVWALPEHPAVHAAARRACLQFTGVRPRALPRLEACLAGAWGAINCTRRVVARRRFEEERHEHADG